MASMTPKQLGELLQEQQEPFILEIYLLERGFLKKRLNPGPGFRCCSGNSNGFLKRSLSLGSDKRRKLFPKCSKIVKAVFDKLVSNRNREKVNKNSSVWENSRSNQETGELDRFSSASSKIVSNSCLESDIEDTPNSLLKKEIDRDKKFQWRCREENKEHSPVSVLEEVIFNEDPSAQANRKQIHRTRDSILPVPLWKFIPQSSSNERNCTDSSFQYSAAERVLEQSKQLLFDCVRELIESQKWKDRRKRNGLEFTGAEEIGRLLCEDMRIWSRLSGNESNTTQLLNADFRAPSIAEWSNFEPQVREVSAVIGEAILEDMSKEIVIDMIELVQPHS